MDDQGGQSGIDRIRREALRRRADATVATSPRAVESTLARISDEVMDDAIARRDRDAGIAIAPTTKAAPRHSGSKTFASARS